LVFFPVPVQRPTRAADKHSGADADDAAAYCCRASFVLCTIVRIAGTWMNRITDQRSIAATCLLSQVGTIDRSLGFRAR